MDTLYLCYICDCTQVFKEYEDTDPEGFLHIYLLCGSCGATYDVAYGVTEN